MANTPQSATDLSYKPCDPKSYRPGIGLIGCGGISEHHLTAYRDAEYDVRALCDIDRSRAKERQEEYFPKADVTTDYHKLLADEAIEVVDITTHPPSRPPIVEAALLAGKHVLSQKPFVTDLDAGKRLCDLAERHGLLLAVNQNGRWAPHFSYLRAAVAAGLLGELEAVHFAVHWDHGWVKDGPFEEVRHLILYDFAIHWFDMLTTLMGDRRPTRVFASTARSGAQDVRPPLLGQALVEYEGAQATLVFDGATATGSWDSSIVVGSEGSLRSEGIDLDQQQVVFTTPKGEWRPKLEGRWFPDGFHGAMGELLCAIEEKRTPTHNARDNLRSLELCFAAVASADRHEPVVPGSVRVVRE